MLPSAVEAIEAVEALTGERLQPSVGGRVHREHRVVALADVDRRGGLRLDAAARFLQDVATGDVREAGVERAVAWVVRRTTLVVLRAPRYGEEVELATWCSGTGSSLAERRTTVTAPAGPAVEAVSLWVSLDRSSLRPVALQDAWFEPYREAAGDRRVRSRFSVPLPEGGAGPSRPWPLRASDIDLLNHLNNAVSWAAVEEEAGRVRPGRRVAWGQVEYRRPLDLGDPVTVASTPNGVGLGVWLLAGTEVASAARVGFADARD